MIVAITGTPGTGKSTLAALLKRNIPTEVIDVNRLLVKERKYASFDRRRNTYVIDPKAFVKLIKPKIASFKKSQEEEPPLEFQKAHCLLESFFRSLEAEPSLSIGKLRTKLSKLALKTKGKIRTPLLLVVDSHLSHLLPPEAIDFCIVAETGLKDLNNRLKSRKYGTLKLSENLEAEAFESSKVDAEEMGHKVIVVRT